jgi:hypothetical protein
MKSVANLEKKEKKTDKDISEVPLEKCKGLVAHVMQPGLVFNYDSRGCSNVAGRDKPTCLHLEAGSKDTLESLVSLCRHQPCHQRLGPACGQPKKHDFTLQVM